MPREVFEEQFVRIIRALQVKPESVELLNQLALKLNVASAEQQDLEQQKAEAIALCNRRIQAAVDLYGDGRLSREEYLRRVELNEREIASWQARTTESEKLAVELGMCIQAVETTNRLWDIASDEDKQGMARHLFEYIVFDLDQQCIVDFRLKPWADQFVMSRVVMHMEEANAENYNENPVVLRGCRMYPRYLVVEFRVRRRRRASLPHTDNPQKVQQHRRVLELRSDGYSYPAIARQLGISVGTAWNYARNLKQ